jgi:hypothetical protein
MYIVREHITAAEESILADVFLHFFIYLIRISNSTGPNRICNLCCLSLKKVGGVAKLQKKVRQEIRFLERFLETEARQRQVLPAGRKFGRVTQKRLIKNSYWPVSSAANFWLSWSQCCGSGFIESGY